MIEIRNTNRFFRAGIFSAVVLTFALAFSAGAQQAKPAAQETPDAAFLKKHVTYLASDELEGRRPGTAGGNKAAEYIAEQFHHLKLGCPTPDLKCNSSGASGASGAAYRQEFPFIAAVELGKNNTLGFTQGSKSGGATLRDEWMPIGYSLNGALTQASAVFVGYGITAAELKHDDYAKAPAKDKIAIAFAGTPD